MLVSRPAGEVVEHDDLAVRALSLTATKRSTMCEPISPAPPVTTTLSKSVIDRLPS